MSHSRNSNSCKINPILDAIKIEPKIQTDFAIFYLKHLTFPFCIWYDKNNFTRISTFPPWWKMNELAILFPEATLGRITKCQNFHARRNCKNRFLNRTCVHKLSSPLLLEERCLIKLSFLLHASRLRYFRRRRIAWNPNP